MNEQIPQDTPVLIEYRKRDRKARSLCFVIAQSDSTIVASGTLDAGDPMGLVTIRTRDVLRWAHLVEAGGGGS